MIEFICRYMFALPDRASMYEHRKSFGALLKKHNLRYRTESEYLVYQDSSQKNKCRWEICFLILPPESQTSKYLASLRLLNESLFQSYLDEHPEVVNASTYMNHSDFPFLIQVLSPRKIEQVPTAILAVGLDFRISCNLRD